MGSMNFLRTAARVALMQPLSDQPDYGSKETTSAELKKFMDPDVKSMQGGLDSIIAKLEKLCKTLPVTSPSKPFLDETLLTWKNLKHDLELQFEDFENVEI